MPPDPLQLPETGDDPYVPVARSTLRRWEAELAEIQGEIEAVRGYAVIDLLMGAIAGFVIGLLAGRLV